MPLTNEYVDATFREIDVNKDNKIQPEELHGFASKFVKVLIIEFKKAKAKQPKSPQKEESKTKSESKP